MKIYMEPPVRVVTYVRKERQLESGTHRACFDYFFTVHGHDSQIASVGITEGWHDQIASLGKSLADEDLVVIAKEFLERELIKGWTPSASSNRLEIPYGAMEYRVHRGFFPG